MIGSGAFGEVFEGKYQGRTVAIKTLKDASESAVREFLSEADVMTRMKHENLVGVYEQPA